LKISDLTKVSKVSRLFLRYCRSSCSTLLQLFHKETSKFSQF